MKFNKNYLNWIINLKKIIREYYLFRIKKIYNILHFDYNINTNGWDYRIDDFKEYNARISKVKELKISSHSNFFLLPPESKEYKLLTQIYSWKSVNIKPYLGAKKESTVDSISNLLEKQLIFPYITLKNTGLKERFYIILPNVRPEVKETLLQLFSYFNYAFIYEIDGEYFNSESRKSIPFESGFMIKLYFPKSMISKFLGIFALLFKYLKITQFISLSNLKNGKDLLHSVYGSLEFLDYYTPLKNLKWNNKENIWMNPKMFSENFKPIYPNLIEVN